MYIYIYIYILYMCLLCNGISLYTHFYTHTHTHQRAHTHIHMRTHTPSPNFTHTLSLTCAHFLSLALPLFLYHPLSLYHTEREGCMIYIHMMMMQVEQARKGAIYAHLSQAATHALLARHDLLTPAPKANPFAALPSSPTGVSMLSPIHVPPPLYAHVREHMVHQRAWLLTLILDQLV